LERKRAERAAQKKDKEGPGPSRGERRRSPPKEKKPDSPPRRRQKPAERERESSSEESYTPPSPPPKKKGGKEKRRSPSPEEREESPAAERSGRKRSPAPREEESESEYADAEEEAEHESPPRLRYGGKVLPPKPPTPPSSEEEEEEAEEEQEEEGEYEGEDDEEEEFPLQKSSGAKVRPKIPDPHLGLPDVPEEEIPDDVFIYEDGPEEDLDLRTEHLAGLYLKRALMERGKVMPSPRAIHMAPIQVANRLEAWGPQPGREEYAFSISATRQVTMVASKIADMATPYLKGKTDERKGKRRKYGNPFPITPAEGQKWPPAVTADCPIGVLGYRDLGLDGWAELYQAAVQQWEEHHPDEPPFGDMKIKTLKSMLLTPLMKDYDKKALVRDTFHAQKAIRAADCRRMLARGVRIYAKFDEFPEEDVSPSGPTGARALSRAVRALEGKRKSSAEEAYQAERAAIAATTSGRGHGSKKSPARVPHMDYTKRIEGNEKLITPAGTGAVVAAPLSPQKGTKVFWGTLQVKVGAGKARPIAISANKSLTPLGLDRATWSTAESVATFARSCDRMIVVDYDPTAPAYTEISEVGAALTSPDGPELKMTTIDPAEFSAPHIGGEIEI
jgi:hypothetical protein